jgi:two-component system, NtrC family, response regulator
VSRVLVIEDEEKIRHLLMRIIGLEGFEVFSVADGHSGLKKLDQHDVDVVLCDVKLPDGNGVDFVTIIKSRFPSIEIILLTAYGNITDGVQAIKNGAFDYITKGDDNNKIIPAIYRAIEKVNLTKEVQRLQKQVGDHYSFDHIIGTSRSILAAIELASKVAVTDTTVLLLGETGTGKEVFARAVHQASPRSRKPFVAINCSAFSRDLLESEMFGYKAGAFTGAIKDKKGLLEEADQGSIFLDEIGEMSIDLQAKLLRMLESGEYIKVGDNKVSRVQVRIIAATHRDLIREIQAGHFREDLYYRLSVFQITLPALRDRLPDIEAIARHFTTLFCAKSNQKPKTLSPEFIEALKQHSWPGNIRELKNIIERSVILSNVSFLSVEHLPTELQRPTLSVRHSKQISAFDLASVEKLHIQKVLNYTEGNKSEAARLLNIATTTLYRKLEEYKIS